MKHGVLQTLTVLKSRAVFTENFSVAASKYTKAVGLPAIGRVAYSAVTPTCNCDPGHQHRIPH